MILNLKRKQLQPNKHLFEDLYEYLNLNDQREMYGNQQNMFMNIRRGDLKTIRLVDRHVLSHKRTHGTL